MTVFHPMKYVKTLRDLRLYSTHNLSLVLILKINCYSNVLEVYHEILHYNFFQVIYFLFPFKSARENILYT